VEHPGRHCPRTRGFYGSSVKPARRAADTEHAVRLVLILAAGITACVATLGAAAEPRAEAACGSAEYSYAGLLSADVGYGVTATIKELARPVVQRGHVAAWVGVGGERRGPNGSDEWLQAGVSAEGDGASSIYYEVKLPNVQARYVRVGSGGAVGHDVRVLQAPRTRDGWAVWVDGRRVSPVYRLPGSRGMWPPVATTESWNGGAGACNRFAFSFADVAVATRPGGGWTPMAARVLQSPGYTISIRRHAGFVAAGGF
jgi:hypothetical protein